MLKDNDIVYHQETVKAPRAGWVLAMYVKENMNVAEGQPMYVLETKDNDIVSHQETIKAPRAGRVVAMYLKENTNVVEGQGLYVLETKEEGTKEAIISSSSIKFDYSKIDGIDSIVTMVLENRRNSVGILSMKNVLLDQDDIAASPGATAPDVLNDDEDVLKRYKSFKKFETILDHPDDHLFSELSSPITQTPIGWNDKINQEWKTLEKGLPETIFVRAYQSRMDLLRAVIIGQKGTPYHDGLFFFDVHLPSTYPDSPPRVRFHSSGFSINPNVLESGDVCLTLPVNVISRDVVKEDLWLPATSNVLQLLMIIQSRILNKDPLFNSNFYICKTSEYNDTKHASLVYNENTLIKSLRTMVYTMNKPPKHFEDLVAGHFLSRIHDILVTCRAYMKGLTVGCPVRDDVLIMKKCPIMFKNYLDICIKLLVSTFNKIRAATVESDEEEHVNIPTETENPHKISVSDDGGDESNEWEMIHDFESIYWSGNKGPRC